VNTPDAIAEIQSNPRSLPAYRYLVTYYEKMGLKNEADAFRVLIEIKLHGSNRSNPSQKQPNNDPEDPGISQTNSI
jgi:hypothetical protein